MKKAPWTKEEVDSLNKFQHSGMFHPFTCGLWEMTRKTTKEDCRALLVATENGWVCSREGCPYTQDWAHDGMLIFGRDGIPPHPEDVLLKQLFGEE